jgi:adenine-specific DNA methylase
MAASFIETQFPVSKLSKESYKERKSNYSQTLTGLGKWWGRKPLILVRATILGLLLPSSSDPARDREIFLKILTMDDEGLLRRWQKKFTVAELGVLATAAEKDEWNERDGAHEAARERVKELRLALKQVPRADKTVREQAKAEIDAAVAEVDRIGQELWDFIAALQKAVFLRLPYEEQIARCDRPEQIEGPSPEAWEEINAHLGTGAANLPELVRELGQRQFGHVPRVGDAFCGGGSIPFEAARIGCEAYGSDLNPVAALLTWAALNIVGGGPEVAAQVREAQQRIYDAVDRQVTAWGIEHRTEDVSVGEWKKLVAGLEAGKLTPGDVSRRVPRADAYLYCVEVTCPETGWRVPLSPSWVIGDKSRCIARLVPDRKERRYDIEILSGVSDEELAAARKGTMQDGYIVHPILREEHKDAASIAQIRLAGRGRDPKARYHESGLRLWEHDDLVPRPDDVFGERLYCVRWVTAFQRENAKGETIWDQRRDFLSPTAGDIEREAQSLLLIRERLSDWQKRGIVPSTMIESGEKTEEPIRTRGWKFWHQLSNPRQLLVEGLFALYTLTEERMVDRVAGTLGIGRNLDRHLRLCVWDKSAANEKVANAFLNQAFNVQFNYGCRTVVSIKTAWDLDIEGVFNAGKFQLLPVDARTISTPCDLWITDPPYADAVNYHELADFFLAWYSGLFKSDFPSWHCGSRKALAVTGSDENFRRSMVDCYRNLAKHMPEDGAQVVMFTHQNAAVWADLALILWAAGLHVTAAWCIATETDTALKVGNYVQGTVLLVLRKRTGEEEAFIDELYPLVEAEVRAQLDSMMRIDDQESPNFSDTDYQLAAYAAALRVLTQYRRPGDFDIERELMRVRTASEPNPVEQLIADAVRIACDHLVPRGFDKFHWKSLSPVERFYLKGLELESHGEFRSGAYMELARGFGLREYRHLLGSGEANETRLKTATEFGRRMISDADKDGDDPFAASLLRHALFAIKEVTAAEGDTAPGRTWLRTELGDKYWPQRKTLLEVLKFLTRLEHTIPAWVKDAASARLLAGAVENDHA